MSIQMCGKFTQQQKYRMNEGIFEKKNKWQKKENFNNGAWLQVFFMKFIH